MRPFLDVFLTFFRIGCLTFGGGYTVLPLLQREVSDSKKWVTQVEVIDYYAVGQCLPGMIGVNTAILIGYKGKGKGGAVAAALGFVMPSLLIILLIASLIQNFAGLQVVQSAFAGIRVAVCALIVSAIYTMAVKGIVNPITAVIAGFTFIATAWLQISPVPQVVLAAVAGVVLSRIDGKLGGKPDGNTDGKLSGKGGSGK
ncbi:MAG: chromate transporter [Peptococcaceae bacterium]|jgi:chromate transporter|nr:chromate transporter [Peptococcaceae bacterium]